LRDEAYARLREAIVTGGLPPGGTIVIDDLARQLSLSAMPVREAIAALVRDGLVETLPRRAHRVRPLLPEDAFHLAEVIATVTVRVYALGAPRVTEEGRAAMRTCIDEHDAAMAAAELPRAVRAVESFHGVVFAACANPDYITLLQGLVPRWERVMLLLFPDAIEQFGPDIMGAIVDALDDARPHDAVAIVQATWEGFAQQMLAAGVSVPAPRQG
jgi:DNA-binding GntR family transcriptional regulator